MRNTLHIIQDTQAELQNAIHQLPRVSADKLGLDERSGTLYVDEENELLIATRFAASSLEYYGGFEYVDPLAVSRFGDWVIYTNDDDRVADAFDYYHMNK